MVNRTEEWLLEYEAKQAARQAAPIHSDQTPPDLGPESMLQSKIQVWAKDKGVPCLCFRQSKKAAGFLVPGWPD